MKTINRHNIYRTLNFTFIAIGVVCLVAGMFSDNELMRIKFYFAGISAHFLAAIFMIKMLIIVVSDRDAIIEQQFELIGRLWESQNTPHSIYSQN